MHGTYSSKAFVIFCENADDAPQCMSCITTAGIPSAVHRHHNADKKMKPGLQADIATIQPILKRQETRNSGLDCINTAGSLYFKLQACFEASITTRIGPSHICSNSVRTEYIKLRIL